VNARGGLLVFAAMLLSSVATASNDPADTLEECAALELRVAGLFRVGTASLYLADCSTARESILTPVAKQFSLDLARSFSGDDLSDTARDLLVRNLDLNSSEQLPETLACLADAYIDAAAGDRFDVVYRPEGSLSLYLNDQLLRRCDDSGSGEKYFMIWFGESPFHRRMRDELLNQAQNRRQG
jgi:hypothetical protein